MDADILRLILIILGGLLLLGIYFWESKRGHPPSGARSRTQAKRRLEPTLSGLGAPSDPLADEKEVELNLRALGSLLDEDSQASFADRHAHQARGLEMPTRPERPPTPETLDAGQPRERRAVPRMILQVLVAAREGYFEGPDLLRAVDQVGLQPGDMQIYHRREGAAPRGPVIFSMASMVEPGTFPLQDMRHFATPGLVLFTQLPGPKDGMEVFSEMLSVAEQLARQLDGELLDETHSVMTRQTIEHVRSEILEHRRKVQIAQSSLR